MPTGTDNRWNFHKNLNEVRGYISGKLRNIRRKCFGLTPISVDRYLLQETICLSVPTFPLASLEGATNNSNQVKKERKTSLKNNNWKKNQEKLSSQLLRFCAGFLEDDLLKCDCLHSYAKVAANFQKDHHIENTKKILLNWNYIIFNSTLHVQLVCD